VIKLRLRRMGAAKRPSYRIVATDSRSPRDGRIIESFGIYNPLTDPATVRIDEDRARHWLSVGAQPSDTVRDIFRRAGLVGSLTAAATAIEVEIAPLIDEAPAVEAAAPARRRRAATPATPA